MSWIVSVPGVGIHVHRSDFLPRIRLGRKSQHLSNGRSTGSDGALDDILLPLWLCLVPVRGGSKGQTYVPVPSGHWLCDNSSITSDIHHEVCEPWWRKAFTWITWEGFSIELSEVCKVAQAVSNLATASYHEFSEVRHCCWWGFHFLWKMMVLLHQNKKRREIGKKCHDRNYDEQ